MLIFKSHVKLVTSDKLKKLGTTALWHTWGIRKQSTSAIQI